MRVCGVTFDGDAATIVVLDSGGPGDYRVVDCGTKKIPLSDVTDNECVRTFSQAFAGVITDLLVEKVVAKRCSYKGKYTSGAASIKMEAIVQIQAPEVVLLPSKSISTAFGKLSLAPPESLSKYQIEAFQAAVVAAGEAE